MNLFLGLASPKIRSIKNKEKPGRPEATGIQIRPGAAGAK